MSHFEREIPNTGWYRGMKIPETAIRNIDEKSKKAISGTGGTYAPSSPIVLGGAGLELQCGLQLTNATANPGVSRRFRFGDDDYFKNETPISRKIVDSPLLLLSNYSLQREARPWLSISATTAPALRTKRAGAYLRMPLRIPDGALLAEVEVGFKVGQTHANVPSNLPKARVIRSKSDGTIEQHPNPASTRYSPEGWVSFPTPVDGTAWYASGALQSFTLSYAWPVTERADTSKYAYALEWVDENGANAFADDVGNYLVYLKTTIYQLDLRPY